MAKALCEGVFVSLHCTFGEESVRVHSLFQEVDSYSFIGRIPDDSLHMLVDFSQSERISAVEKAIRRKMDSEKDTELLNWFRLLKRVYALDIIRDSQMAAGLAEYILKQGFNNSYESKDVGIRYRTHLKTLYTELPDAKEEGKNIVPVYALPETKTWVLGEITNGWNSSGGLDGMDCLMFLSAATDTLSLGGNRYLSAFSRMRGWDEIRKCVRNLLRERSKDFSEKEIAEFLKLPMLSGTVVAVLWHTLIAKTVEYEGTRAKLRIMLESVSW